MKKILNPFRSMWHENYNCFGCSPHNEIGLQLTFYDAGNELIADWQPRKLLEGYPDVVHGGIQATLLDEICAWTVYVKAETAGVTKQMNVFCLRPLRISKGKVTLRSTLIEKNEKEAILKAELFDGEGNKCAEGEFTYFIYPPEIAVKRFQYPGIEAFYETP
ncbi:MAG: PaaI family thioesterase [Prolixibacteraceae bacterium]|nr:PaaI family thioesterase [Prolixibacteraceae bacterium]